MSDFDRGKTFTLLGVVPLFICFATLISWPFSVLKIWGFPKIEVPPVIIHFNGIFLTKTKHLGVATFRKPPFVMGSCGSCQARHSTARHGMPRRRQEWQATA